jgi:hypothetical protein
MEDEGLLSLLALPLLFAGEEFRPGMKEEEMVMTPRTSLIGGIISFVAVILLSWLSLDLVEEGALFGVQVAPPGAEAPEVGQPIVTI